MEARTSTTPPESSPAWLERAEVLFGTYGVERVLGQAELGLVVAARHLELDQRVAIKLLSDEAASDPRCVARFRREGRVSSKLDSDHVPRVLDMGLSDGTYYLVMELLEGSDLKVELKRRGPIPIEEACSIALQSLEALSKAHAAGIVHRDLKPENVFLTERPDGSRLVKVLGFGVSGGPFEMPSARTNREGLTPVPLHVAPERIWAPKSVDFRADLWSFGVLFYEMLSGRSPYDAHSFPELRDQLLRRGPHPLDRLAPEIPEELARLVMECLCLAPEGRPKSALLLARRIESFLARSKILTPIRPAPRRAVNRVASLRLDRLVTVPSAGLQIRFGGTDASPTGRGGPERGAATKEKATTRGSSPAKRFRSVTWLALALVGAFLVTVPVVLCGPPRLETSTSSSHGDGPALSLTHLPLSSSALPVAERDRAQWASAPNEASERSAAAPRTGGSRSAWTSTQHNAAREGSPALFADFGGRQ